MPCVSMYDPGIGLSAISMRVIKLEVVYCYTYRCYH